MSQQINRKPIGNFFIKKSLQLRLILKIVLASLISTILSSGTLILVYYLKYKTVIVYQLDKISQELSREHIVYLILPTLLISSVVSILVSVGVGLYASRKYAVPVYKLEQWASLLRMGKMSALLRFREKEEMAELSNACNQLSSEMRERFIKIRTQSELLKQSAPSSPIAEEIEKVLSGLELETVPIEVSTTFYSPNPVNPAEQKQ
jgi:nitrogen fixation/metabolism regulation signal transduction histidine kinase